MTRPTAEQQREQMHKRVAADAKLHRDEMAELRRRAEERDARRNEPVTRGEIIDAINHAMHVRGGNVGDHHDADTEVLRALREAFE